MIKFLSRFRKKNIKHACSLPHTTNLSIILRPFFSKYCYIFLQFTHYQNLNSILEVLFYWISRFDGPAMRSPLAIKLLMQFRPKYYCKYVDEVFLMFQIKVKCEGSLHTRVHVILIFNLHVKRSSMIKFLFWVCSWLNNKLLTLL